MSELYQGLIQEGFRPMLEPDPDRPYRPSVCHIDTAIVIIAHYHAGDEALVTIHMPGDKRYDRPHVFSFAVSDEEDSRDANTDLVKDAISFLINNDYRR